MEDATCGFSNEQGYIWWFPNVFYFSSNSYPVNSSWKKIISSSIGIHIWGKGDFFSIFFDRRRRVPRCPLFVTMCGAHVLSVRAGGLGLAVVISRVELAHQMLGENY